MSKCNSFSQWLTTVPPFQWCILDYRDSWCPIDTCFRFNSTWPSRIVCGLNGCQLQEVMFFREDRDQYYYKCKGDPLVSDIPEQGEGHNYLVKSTITNYSFWYQRKVGANKILAVMMDYLRKESLQQIFDSRSLSKGAICQVIRDIQVMMLSDYERHVLTPENLLGANPRCHHIQIDESKIGKRKNHRGSRVEGVWVFGMVEALVPESGPLEYRYVDNTRGIDEMRPKYVAGRRFFCTVPNRVAATLLPIIYKYCKPGTIIRSDGWRAYNGLHHQATQDQMENRGLYLGESGQLHLCLIKNFILYKKKKASYYANVIHIV